MKRRLTIDDLFRIKLLDAPAISPDGKKIAFTLKWVEQNKNKYFSNIYIVNLENNKIIQFTRGEHSDRRPKWSPDMKYLAFISNREDKNRIWIIPTDGGEGYPITETDGSFAFYNWSPDSRYIAYSFKKKYEQPEKNEEKEDKDKSKHPDYYIIDDMQYKIDGMGIIAGDKYHVYIVNIEDKEVNQLTADNFHDINPVFSPDGKIIAFCSNRSEDIIDDPENDDIFTINRETKETKLITKLRGTKSSINWSPDGKHIVFLGNHEPIGLGWVKNLQVHLVPSSGGEDILLSKDFDFSASNKIVGDLQEFSLGPSSSPQFFNHGKNIAFLATVKGACELYSVSADGGKPEKIFGGKMDVESFHIDREGRNIALIMGDLTHPHELYHLKRENEKWVLNKVTKFNDFIHNEIDITEPEDISFTNGDGVDIHGWLVKPPEFDPHKKYPLVLQIHGGPHVCYGYTFFHEMHFLAANNYCVLYTNPRGSQGYGNEYAEAIRPHWGTPDDKDQMEFVELLISKGFIDENNMFVAGGSYGGFMSVYLISRTDKFKAAIAERSVVNMSSLFGVSDYGYTFRFAVEGIPWEEPEIYNVNSPLYNVKNIKTPLLIMHSEKDYRAPIDQADQLYTAMKFLRKEVKYIRFTGESHGLSRCGAPENRKIRLKFILDWFENYRK